MLYEVEYILGLLRPINKKLILLSVLVVSLVTLGVVLQSVDAVHPPGKDTIIVDLPNGDFNVSFRNDFNSNPQSSTITVDSANMQQDGFFTITVNDADANLDPNALDQVIASASSTTSGTDVATTVLTETGLDTGVFEGRIFRTFDNTSGDHLRIGLVDSITVIYEPEPFAVARFHAALTGIVGSSSVLLKDGIWGGTEQFDATCPYDLFIRPVNMTFTDAVAAGIVTTLSYANAELGGNDPLDLVMVYRPSPFSAFITLSSNTAAHDTVGKTISSQIYPTVNTIDGPSNGNGEYALGFDLNSCGGGGGGGFSKSTLVVNALGFVKILTGGGGSGGSIAPSFGSSSMASQGDMDGISGVQMSADGMGGIISETEYKPFDTTRVAKTGERLSLKFDLYENGGAGNLQHVTLYTNIRGDQNVADSDTYILYDKNQSVHVIDPHGFFKNASFDIIEKDTFNLVLMYDITFAKAMEKSHIILRSWDTQKHSSDLVLLDALEVTGPPAEIEQILKVSTTEIEFTEVAQGIPIWVKNNANWWSERQIGDDDFVAGIEYLIEQNIINVPLAKSSIVISEPAIKIPDYIHNIAGWWADESIPDDEFVQALQWLITNGIMKV